MALNAETSIHKARDELLNLFHDAYQQHIDHVAEERDNALTEASKARADAEQARREVQRLEQESKYLKEEMSRWKQEAEVAKRQLARTGAKLSLTIAPLGHPEPSNDGPISYRRIRANTFVEVPKARRQRQMGTPRKGKTIYSGAETEESLTMSPSSHRSGDMTPEPKRMLWNPSWTLPANTE